ncbi:uncharacterized protein DEA37_0001806 [Paragonimus westermani]|uniref:Uncharacterized protein n=1 Tax=Paragonimus westermani TaxID=34504 RepID=A0A5J4NXP0_9TREM|nr:uncharacterized protein DEA37_0001806 [Paragonimus westermani]
MLSGPACAHWPIDSSSYSERRTSDCEYVDVELLPDTRLRDLEYADDNALPRKGSQGAQKIVDRLRTSVHLLNMVFAFAYCKVLLQNWQDSASALTLGSIRALFKHISSSKRHSRSEAGDSSHFSSVQVQSGPSSPPLTVHRVSLNESLRPVDPASAEVDKKSASACSIGSGSLSDHDPSGNQSGDSSTTKSTVIGKSSSPCAHSGSVVIVESRRRRQSEAREITGSTSPKT